MVVAAVIRRNRWSLLSILITVGNAILIWTIVRYLYWRSLWELNPSVQNLLTSWGDTAVLLSVVAALVGLAKDKSRGYSILALCLSLFSVMFYVR
jgi:uncharacterized membrane protein YidH (DUF202 family)